MKIFINKKFLFLVLSFILGYQLSAQSIVDIRFNLYADSVKTTIDNYINVEAKLSDGRFIPLTSENIIFKSDYGYWEGNSLVLSKEKNIFKVNISAQLRDNPSKNISTTVYVQQYPDAGAFLSEENFMKNQRNRQQPVRQQRTPRRIFLY